MTRPGRYGHRRCRSECRESAAVRGARLDRRARDGVRRCRRAHLVRRHPGRRRSLDRARRRHGSAPPRGRARRTPAARLDPVQPPPLGPHTGAAVPPQRRPARRRRDALGAGRRRCGRPARRAGTGDVAAALPDHARPAAGDVDVQRHGARAAADRRRRRAHPRDRPQGRGHVRAPARRARPEPGVPPRPLPVDRRAGAARRGTSDHRRGRRPRPRRSVRERRSGTRPSASATP